MVSLAEALAATEPPERIHKIDEWLAGREDGDEIRAALLEPGGTRNNFRLSGDRARAVLSMLGLAVARTSVDEWRSRQRGS